MFKTKLVNMFLVIKNNKNNTDHDIDGQELWRI